MVVVVVDDEGLDVDVVDDVVVVTEVEEEDVDVVEDVGAVLVAD